MYTVGSIIKNEREKHKISQEELCFGICAVSTLSRIEHNEQTPTMEKAMALLNRLGLEGSRYLSFVSEDEHEFYRINCDVEQMLALRKYKEAYEYVMEHKQYMDKNKFRKQFLCGIKAIKLCYEDKQYETAITMTEEAIRYTCPHFEKSKKIRYFLTDMEVNIINVMAVSYWWSGKNIIAINLLMNLTDALREQYSTIGIDSFRYPMVLCNLAQWLNEQRRYEEADEYIEIGLEACIKSGKMRMLPFFCCCKAAVLLSMNCPEEHILREYISAYVMFKSMGLYDDAMKLRSYLLELYNRDLEHICAPKISSST